MDMRPLNSVSAVTCVRIRQLLETDELLSCDRMGTVVVSSSVFTSNTAVTTGGGLDLVNSQQHNISGSMLTLNTAQGMLLAVQPSPCHAVAQRVKLSSPHQLASPTSALLPCRRRWHFNQQRDRKCQYSWLRHHGACEPNLCIVCW